MIKNQTVKLPDRGKDNPREVIAAVVMAVVSISVFLGMPVIVGALTNGYGLSEAEAGYLASAGTAGTALASLLVSVLVSRVDRRQLLLVGLLVGAIFNGAMALTRDYEFLLPIAFAAGGGAGVVYAMGIALLAGTHQTGRNFSILLFVQVTVGGLELYYFPKLAIGFGPEGIYGTIAAAFLLSTVLLPVVPRYYQTDVTQLIVTAERKLLLAPWFCLAAVFCFYLTVGSFWAYVERLGAGAGLSSESISSYLSFGNLLSVAGCGLAYWLSKRVGQGRPLLIALACISAAFGVLSAEVNVQVYLLGLFTFFLLWNLIDIFQLSTLSELDHCGRYAALVPACQSVGSSLGTMIAARMLSQGRTISDVMIMDSIAAMTALFCFLVVYARCSINTKKVATVC